MTAVEIVEKVKGKFPDAFTSDSVLNDEAVVIVDPSKWSSVATWLAGEGGFSFLSDLCGIDYLGSEPRFEVVYQLLNIEEAIRIRVRLPLGDSDHPKAPSVMNIWPTANWQEREAFDLFGIVFEGHPDLSRILMPDDWEGHPLRKDYSMGKVPIEYKFLSPGA